MKKLISILLAVLMLASLGTAALAEETDAEAPAADGGPTLYPVVLEIYLKNPDGSLVPGSGGIAQVSATSAEPGTLVTVTAEPWSGYELVHIDYGNGSVVGTDITEEQCFYMENFQTHVMVVFRKIPTHLLAVETYPAYTGKVSSSLNPEFWVSVIDLGGIPEGYMSLEARPEDDYRFSHWEDKSGHFVSSQNPYTYYNSADVELTAVFEYFKVPDTYTFTDGAGSTWTRGSDKEVRLTVERNVHNSEAYLLFKEAKINGTVMQLWIDYGYTSGPVDVILYPTFLEKLAPGDYTITAVFANGECDTTITVLDKPSVSINSDATKAKAAGDWKGLYARIALILDNNGVSGLYVTQATINDDGTIIIPAFRVPGLTVKGVNVSLVPTLDDILSPTPNAAATVSKTIK